MTNKSKEILENSKDILKVNVSTGRTSLGSYKISEYENRDSVIDKITNIVNKIKD